MVHATRNRISKIEQRINAPHLAGKLVVVRGGANDGEVTELLERADIDVANPAHTIVILRTLYEANAGGEYSFPAKPEILHVMDKK
jgi:hypothetical protein